MPPRQPDDGPPIPMFTGRGPPPPPGGFGIPTAGFAPTPVIQDVPVERMPVIVRMDDSRPPSPRRARLGRRPIKLETTLTTANEYAANMAKARLAAARQSREALASQKRLAATEAMDAALNQDNMNTVLDRLNNPLVLHMRPPEQSVAVVSGGAPPPPGAPGAASTSAPPATPAMPALPPPPPPPQPPPPPPLPAPRARPSAAPGAYARAQSAGETRARPSRASAPTARPTARPSRASTPAPQPSRAPTPPAPSTPEGAYAQPIAARPSRAKASARPSARPSASSSSAAPPRRSVSRSRSAGGGIGALPGLPALPEDDEVALDVLGELYATAQQMAEVADKRRKREPTPARASRSRSAPRKRANQDTSEANVM